MDLNSLAGVGGGVPTGPAPTTAASQPAASAAPKPSIGAAAEFAASAPASAASNAGIVRTYSEVQLDPATHSITFAVRSSDTGEVLMAWPLSALGQLAATREYFPGSLMERLA
ncbi:MAG: hypothetical protein ACRDGF_05070 [Chloroflexota bacterium]